MMRETVNKIWKDPVWSKVISVFIISILVIIYNAISAFVKGVNFITSLNDFSKIEIKLWIILFVLIIYILTNTLRVYLKKKRTVPFEYDDKTMQLDIVLFNQIRDQMLPYHNIEWLRKNNFGGYSFNDEKLDAFDIIEAESKKPDFEFFNPTLEKLKSELVNSISDFNSFLIPNVFAAGVTKLTVPPEWEIEQPERFSKAVEGIHFRAQIVANKYDAFIKTGRKTLKK